MPKPEWGVKRTCTSCRARFYDLGRDPVVCPKCGAELDVSESVKIKRTVGRAVPATTAAAEEEELVYDEEEELVYGEEEEAVEEGEEAAEEAALVIEEEDEEAGDIPVPKKGKEDAELENFDEDVLLGDEEEDVDEELDDIDEDDDLKNV